MAEWHHGLDSFFGNPPPDPAAFQAAYKQLWSRSTPAGSTPTPTPQPDPKQPGSFVYPTTESRLNYLPDVLARQLILQGLPGPERRPRGSHHRDR